MNRPRTTIMCGLTLDGKIAPFRSCPGVKPSFGPYLNRKVAEVQHKHRAEFDAMMVGGNTVAIDDPSLTARFGNGKNPVRVVVDPEAVSPLNAKVFNDKQAETVVAVTSQTDESYISALKERGVTVALCGDGEHVELKLLMDYLSQRGIKTLMLEGGGILNWLMLNEGLVDDLLVFVVNIITGRKTAPALAEGPGQQEFEDVVELRYVSTKVLDGVQLVHYEVKKDF